MSSSSARRSSAKGQAPVAVASPGSFSLEAFTPYRLAVLARDVSRSLATVYSERFGLRIAEWRILAALAHFGPMPAGLVAERSSLDKPKVTRAVQQLVSRKLVTRRTASDDRRAVEIALTSKGRDIFEAAAALAVDWERQMLTALDAGEQRKFSDMLDRLNVQVRRLAEASGQR